MADSWMDLIAQEGYWPPFVVLIRRDQSDAFGSGVLIDSLYVLTCHHNFLSEKNFENASRASISHDLPDADYRQTRIYVYSDGHSGIEADLVGSDLRNDLALLKLSRPVHGIAVPGPAKLDGSKIRVVACGFLSKSESERQFAFEPGEAETTGLTVEGKLLQAGLKFGPQGGFSGGPVLALGASGLPEFVGMTRLGGDYINYGKYTAGAQVIQFLKSKSLELKPHSPGPSAWHRNCLLRGHEPVHRIKPHDNWSLPPFACLLDAKEPHKAPTYVAMAPISAAVLAWALKRDVLPGADRVPAHVANPGDVAVVIDWLSKETGYNLHLATEDEWLKFSGEVGIGLGAKSEANAARRATGLPVTLSDLIVETGDTIHLRHAPPRMGEWLHTRSGPTIFVSERPASLTRPPAASSDVTRTVLRLAFSMSGATQ